LLQVLTGKPRRPQAGLDTSPLFAVFNQKSLYNAYKKRTAGIPYTQEEYERAKANDPNFFADDSNLQYGQVRYHG
jgi:hypothetical protein